MGLTSDTVTVGDATPVRIGTPVLSSAVEGASVLIQNQGAASLWLGGSDVDSSNGIEVAAGASISLNLFKSDALYGISASGDLDVRVLQAG